MSPYSFDVSPSCVDSPQVTHDSIPIGAIPLLACATPEYQEAVTKTIQAANSVYQGNLYLSWIYFNRKYSSCNIYIYKITPIY